MKSNNYAKTADFEFFIKKKNIFVLEIVFFID
jgi:hypothetical protein